MENYSFGRRLPEYNLNPPESIGICPECGEEIWYEIEECPVCGCCLVFEEYIDEDI